ncbi:MAG: alkaline phosphatase family protein [Clostridia bacterium]|nr:alkaline phosphatase family protein [Clostridia bacterium]
MLKKPELFMLGVDGGVTSYVLEQIEKGKLPNFKKMIDNGCMLSDCRPVYPSISATCWATIQTGASPHMHQITDENILLEGAYPNEFVTAYHGDYLMAERFWEAAAKKGKKSLIADFCVSGPAKSDLVHQIGGIGSVADQKAIKTEQTMRMQKEISEQLYLFDTDVLSVFPKIPEQTMAPSGKWQPQIKLTQSRYEKSEKGYFKLYVEKKNDLENPNNIEPFYWIMSIYDEGIKIAFNEADMENGQYYEIPMGNWSEVIKRTLKDDLGEGSYRFRIKAMKANDKGGFFVFITSSVNLFNALSPYEFANRVNEIDEICSSNSYGHFLTRDGYIDTAFELIAFKNEWFKKIILDSMENDPVEIMAFVQGYTDTVNHVFRGLYEGVEKSNEQQVEIARYVYEKAYDMLDDFIGWLYENVIGEDTVFIIIGDHGAVGFNRTVLVHDFFEKEGFLKYIPHPKNEHVYWRDRKIDWKNTKAFPVGCGNIYINLKGREPEGIVDPEDYDKTVNEIIKILHKYHWNEKDECYLAFAVEKKQAGFIGLGTERVGDVIYGLSGNSTGGYIGGVHACQIPSAKTKTGDIRCLCMFSGKNIKKGELVDRPANLEDIAPTLCYLLKYPQPASATGGILFQIFKDDMYQNS